MIITTTLDNIFPNRVKRRYYKFLIRKIQRQLWDMELRILTIKEIREGIRREYDRINIMIKGNEEEIEKMMVELGIEVEIKDPDPKKEKNNREELEKVRKEIKNEELIGLNPETRDRFVNKTAGKTRVLRMEWLRMKAKTDLTHGEEKIKKEKELKEIGSKILNFIELKQGLETDAQHMKEQMMGKWSEEEGKKVAGIDQEIEKIKGEIAGGISFQVLIKDERRKI